MDRDVKLLGGFGALLIVLSVVPLVGGLFALVGLILLTLAVKRLSEREGRRELFLTFVRGIAIYFLGSLVGFLIGSVTYNLSEGGKEFSLLTYFLASLSFVIVYSSTVIGTYLLKEVFSEIAFITGNGLFDWAGKFLFWGALLTVIVVGILITWVGWILLAVAFFTTEDNLEEQ